MSQRIPEDAFDFYVGLGPTRSYQAVADRYGVSKRAIVKHAAREGWAKRLREIQAAARAEGDRKIAAELGDMHERHVKMLKAMGIRALNGMKEFPLRSGMEAVRAAELVIKLERIIHGEPTEPGEESLEEITRREIQTLLTVEDEEEGDQPPGDAAAPQ